MSSTVTAKAGNIAVVIHVHPTPVQAQHNARFNRGQPVALGTVQIMIGAMVMLFGIAMSFSGSQLAVFTGVYFWGGLTYIIAGGLTVAASKSVERCLMNGCLAVNITSAVFSFVGVVICSVDCVLTRYPSRQTNQGFAAILAFFQFVQFAISITLAGFGCHATCDCGGEPPSGNSEAPPTSQGPSQVSREMMSLAKTSEDPASSDVPPAYEVY